MTKHERQALLRVLSDLIRTDGIINKSEISHYEDVKNNFSITSDDEVEAGDLLLSDAVATLQSLDAKTMSEVKKVLFPADKDCYPPKSEAVFLMALHCCLDCDSLDNSEIISIPADDYTMDLSQVIYVESMYDDSTNNKIVDEYRNIKKEFKLAGFNFVYIPEIAKYYYSCNQDLLSSVIHFLRPSLTNEYLQKIVRKLSQMETVDFVKDILCFKFGMKSLRDTEPALLVNIGCSFVGVDRYANILKINIADRNPIDIVRNLMDFLLSLLHPGLVSPSIVESRPGMFVYDGFYKQLIDLYTIKKNVRSKVVIYPNTQTISLEDIDRTLSLHRKEKALYTLFLLESPGGGINFDKPSTFKQKQSFDERMSRLQFIYASLYSLFGGDKENAPNISDASIRRPMISSIKRAFLPLRPYLHNYEDYLIEKDARKNYKVRVEEELCCYYDVMNERYRPLTDYLESKQ